MVFPFSRFLVDPKFSQVLDDLSNKNIHASKFSSYEPDYTNIAKDYENESKVSFIDKYGTLDLDPKLGQKAVESLTICAYDESLSKISALEGSGFFVSHGLVLMEKEQYLPLTYLTFDFYTKSQTIADGNNSLSFTNEPPEIASKKKYIKDREMILSSYIPDNTILLVDGPLIGSQMTEHNLQLVESLLKRDIFPLFFVKNSDSSLIVDNISTLKNKFNSDFDWAYNSLKVGQISSFAKYIDLTDNSGRRNKIFAYMKAFDAAPIRIEMHDTVYAKLQSKLNTILSLIYYLLLAQGNLTNPQPRPIAISEKYAREALRVINLERIIKQTGIKPTMNFTRFGW